MNSLNVDPQICVGHTDVVVVVAWSPDGTHLASSSWDHTVRVWDAASGALLRTSEGHTKIVFGEARSSDGQRLVSASVDHTVRIWKAVRT